MIADLDNSYSKDFDTEDDDPVKVGMIHVFSFDGAIGLLQLKEGGKKDKTTTKSFLFISTYSY